MNRRQAAREVYRSAAAVATVVAVLLVLPALPAHAADGSLVIAALRVLEAHYVDPVQPVDLLNAAVAALRSDAHLDPVTLPDIPAGASEDQAEAAFLEEFATAVRSGVAPPTQLAYAATERMLAHLHDSHTYFLEPAASQGPRDGSGGAGIGVLLTSRQDGSGASWVFVDDVLPNSPASLAGIRRFDRILQIGDAPLGNASVEDAGRLLQGPAGSAVTLLVERGSTEVTIQVVRARVRWQPVAARALAPGVIYLRVFEFSRGVARAVRDALEGLARPDPPRAIILDLRANPGGLLSEAQRVGAVFLPAGATFATVNARGEDPHVLDTFGGGDFVETPLVVLVDGESASAAEVLVAALKDHHRATIVGDRTAGALGGAVMVALPEGAMSVTVERIRGPEGERVEGVGIAPDLQVPLSFGDMVRGEDTQLYAALKVVRGLHTATGGPPQEPRGALGEPRGQRPS
jgi:carboxyl-terminal processing protease